MKVILQRVSEARVRIDDVVAGEIGAGLMILFCAEDGDLAESVER
jgi:D-tyrosyl-tRNA(Tyr) deacylase